MRGKLTVTDTRYTVRRITPADAGKTYLKVGATTEAEDHPRGCGENQDVSATSRKTAGSPPRMRGKRRSAVLLLIDFGITPADAGKTATFVSAGSYM